MAPSPKPFSARGQIEAFINRRHPPARTPIQLSRQRIYILPTGQGYVFGIVLLVMFLWAINYNNSMAFALTFLLIGVVLNSMWHCHNNLLNVRVYPGHADPVFVGQPARYRYPADHSDTQDHIGLALQASQGTPDYQDIPASGQAAFEVEIPTTRRGWLTAGRLQLTTHYPLGFFQAWSWLHFEQACLVFPKPAGRQPLPPYLALGSGDGPQDAGSGSDDFGGLRGYLPGDSLRHVAWKAASRSDDLQVKEFVSQRRPDLWLDWELVQAETLEAKLSQLCQWVLQAEENGLNYGLRLPGIQLPPAQGDYHQRHCLEALALYQLNRSVSS